MQYAVIAVFAVLAVLILVAVIRTLTIKAPAIGKCETEITQEEIDLCAQKL